MGRVQVADLLGRDRAVRCHQMRTFIAYAISVKPTGAHHIFFSRRSSGNAPDAVLSAGQ